MEIAGELSRDRKLLAHKIITQVSNLVKVSPASIVAKTGPGRAYGPEVRKAKAVALEALKYYGFSHGQAAEIIALKSSNASVLRRWYCKTVSYWERKVYMEKLQKVIIR